ncbi:MAG TPA: hypothetical protein VNA25_10130 [Phycisphaerae bacterium]|nr:hypothetical protein [Phycisphaerae bacterium]
MNECDIRQKLIELAKALNKTLRSSTAGLKTDGIYLAAYPRAKDGRLEPEEILDELSLQVKYLMFDLEATRRENRYLKQLLESRPKRPRDDQPDGGPGNT